MMKSFDDVQVYGKQGFDAYVASANALTKGFQAIAAEAAEYTKKAFADSSAAAEQLVASKSIEKAIEVQQGYAKKAYEGFVAQATRINELYLAAAKDAYKPFEAQFSQFTTKTGK